MDFLEELRWRGMLHDLTPGADELLMEKPVTGYIGFDPTAPSMTIGNFVQIMLLRLFQLSGHRPVVLMGGATGRIGDPSFKEKERELKSPEELDHNLDFQVRQLRKFIDFDGPNAAILVNNLDFYKNMSVLDFLRDAGKTLTVNYMMSKDSVKSRLQTGISFTEFSYQLLQAYDFQVLYNMYNCRLQMGGSDQWGNITSGTEFIRRNVNGKAYAITTPLLTKADGTKFGKSEEGNIWLDPEMTSAYKFYQFWLNADDADISRFTRYFTLKSKEDVEMEEKEYADNPRKLKSLLAEELTKRVHSDEDFKSVMKVSDILFGKNVSEESLKQLTPEELKTISDEIPSFRIESELLSTDVDITSLLCEHTNILSSRSEVRKAIQNNAISVNKVKVTSHEYIPARDSFIQGRYIMVENGKKNKYVLEFI